MTLDKETSKLEIKVAQEGHEKLRMMGPSLAGPTTALERVVTLLSWL